MTRSRPRQTTTGPAPTPSCRSLSRSRCPASTALSALRSMLSGYCTARSMRTSPRPICAETRWTTFWSQSSAKIRAKAVSGCRYCLLLLPTADRGPAGFGQVAPEQDARPAGVGVDHRLKAGAGAVRYFTDHLHPIHLRARRDVLFNLLQGIDFDVCFGQKPRGRLEHRVGAHGRRAGADVDHLLDVGVGEAGVADAGERLEDLFRRRADIDARRPFDVLAGRDLLEQLGEK